MAYLYRHIRLDKDEVFYIGIGGIKKDNDLIYQKEIEFIKLYGRADKGEGTLCNLTDGGESPKGALVSKETKEKISNSLRGNKFALGFSHTEEARDKMSKKRKGIKKSEIHNKKNSESMKLSWANRKKIN